MRSGLLFPLALGLACCAAGETPLTWARVPPEQSGLTHAIEEATKEKPAGLKYPWMSPLVDINGYGHPMPIDEVAFDFPELRVIVAHMGGNYHYEALILAEKHPNIYLDTAYLPFFCKRLLPPVTPAELIERAVRILGPERILYAYEGLAPSVVRDLAIPEEAKRLILGANAARLFGLHLSEPSRGTE